MSRSSGVSLGVPRVLTSLWNVETAVLIWKIPEATAWVVSCFPFIKPRRGPTDRPDSRSWKLIFFSCSFEFWSKFTPNFRNPNLKVCDQRGQSRITIWITERSNMETLEFGVGGICKEMWGRSILLDNYCAKNREIGRKWRKELKNTNKKKKCTNNISIFNSR